MSSGELPDDFIMALTGYTCSPSAFDLLQTDAPAAFKSIKEGRGNGQ